MINADETNRHYVAYGQDNGGGTITLIGSRRKGFSTNACGLFAGNMSDRNRNRINDKDVFAGSD